MNNTNKKKVRNAPIQDGENASKYPYNGLFIGLFFITTGALILLNNFEILTNQTVLVLLFILSIYLIFLSVLHIIRKIYFVLGLLLLTAFTSSLTYLYAQNRIIWPVIMGLISIGIIIYGFVFKPHNKISYIIPGISLIIIGILVFFTAIGNGVFKVSQFFYHSWPLLLIALGFYNTKKMLDNKKVSKKEKTPALEKKPIDTVQKNPIDADNDIEK